VLLILQKEEAKVQLRYLSSDKQRERNKGRRMRNKGRMMRQLGY
jgi:hypothetical protein